MSPGSDTANLSVLGYDPRKYYSGRSPLEALSIGVPLEETDVALRCNLVTLSEEEEKYKDRTMLDHSAGEISTEDAAALLDAVRQELATEEFHFHVGTSYRHLLVWEHGEVRKFAQPHDILGQKVGAFLPDHPRFAQMMERSYEILSAHPINLERKEKGLPPANSCWFWGAGKKPSLTSFEELTGKKGAMVSAVDLLKGIAVGASMKVCHVEGANGGLHTNYEGKAKAALDALLGEVQAIENLDQRILRPIVEGLKAAGEECRMVILPDHPTPVAIRTHTADDVPYLLYDSTREQDGRFRYTEEDAAKTGRRIEDGHLLMRHLLMQTPT